MDFGSFDLRGGISGLILDTIAAREGLWSKSLVQP